MKEACIRQFRIEDLTFVKYCASFFRWLKTYIQHVCTELILCVLVFIWFWSSTTTRDSHRKGKKRIKLLRWSIGFCLSPTNSSLQPTWVLGHDHMSTQSQDGEKDTWKVGSHLVYRLRRVRSSMHDVYWTSTVARSWRISRIVELIDHPSKDETSMIVKCMGWRGYEKSIII